MRLANRHQLIGVREGQRPQEGRIDRGPEAAGEADAEREQRHDGDRERGVVGEGAEGRAKGDAHAALWWGYGAGQIGDGAGRRASIARRP